MYTHLVYMLLDLEVKKWGNSYGLRLTKKAAKQLDINSGDVVNIDVVKKRRTTEGFGMFKGAPSFEREDEDREY